MESIFAYQYPIVAAQPFICQSDAAIEPSMNRDAKQFLFRRAFFLFDRQTSSPTPGRKSGFASDFKPASFMGSRLFLKNCLSV
jgi:hypothetical protein